MLDLIYFKTPAGNSPVDDYLGSQQAADRALILSAIEDFCEQFPDLATVNVRSLRDKIWELRVRGAAGRHHRILYFVASGAMIALSAYLKKTNKTPGSEIELAKKRLRKMVG